MNQHDTKSPVFVSVFVFVQIIKLVTAKKNYHSAMKSLPAFTVACNVAHKQKRKGTSHSIG